MGSYSGFAKVIAEVDHNNPASRKANAQSEPGLSQSGSGELVWLEVVWHNLIIDAESRTALS